MSTEHRRWTGRWIWDRTDGTEPNAYVLFRRTFELREPPARALLRITATTRYHVYLNGERLGEGPPKSQPYHTYFDEYVLGAGADPAARGAVAASPYPLPVAATLERGDNVIAVLVQHVGYDDDSVGGLLAELLPIGRDGTAGDAIVATDGEWKVTRSAAWRADSFFCFFNRVVPYQEHFDARRIDPRWTSARYDDSRWSFAAVRSTRGHDRPPRVAPWTGLVPRDIPWMRETRRYASTVAEVGEITAAMNRMRSDDLSIALSQPSLPLELATVSDPDALCSADGECSLGCSTGHRRDTRVGIREPVVMLDFGRIINAYVEVDVTGPVGARIDLGYAERLLDGHFNNAIEGQFADSITLREGRTRRRIFAWKAFRYVRVRVHDAFAPLVIHELAAVETAYPFEARGSFRSGDAELDSIHEISEYTVRLASNEYITDTPWREQGQWLGDVAAVTFGAIFACFGDTALNAKFLRQSGATQHPSGPLGNMTNTYSAKWQGAHIDFSLWWLMAVRDYYRYTGDEQIVHDLYPTAVKLIETVLAHRNERGLIEDMPYTVFIDWADVDTTGVCAAFNAITAGALDAIAELADVRGDTWQANRSRAAREALRAVFDETFWVDAESLYCDAVDGTRSTGRFSEQANAAAIEFGLAPTGRTEAIIDRLWARGDAFLAGTNNGVTEANPFFTAVVLKALARAGRHDLGVRLIRDRWGRRMLDAGSTSTHEEWSLHGSWRRGDELMPIMRTMSHAWGAFPARWLIEHLAGIEILEPGCTRLRVRPVTGVVNYESRFPTPRGEVSVTVRDDEVTVEAPKDVEVER